MCLGNTHKIRTGPPAKLKTGVALLNFGGPWTLSDVKPFLYRLFVNPAVLVGVPAPFRHLLAFTIAQIKGPWSIRCYWRRIAAAQVDRSTG